VPGAFVSRTSCGFANPPHITAGVGCCHTPPPTRLLQWHCKNCGCRHFAHTCNAFGCYPRKCYLAAHLKCCCACRLRLPLARRFAV
jgi:hypothetical protein